MPRWRHAPCDGSARRSDTSSRRRPRHCRAGLGHPGPPAWRPDSSGSSGTGLARGAGSRGTLSTVRRRCWRPPRPCRFPIYGRPHPNPSPWIRSGLRRARAGPPPARLTPTLWRFVPFGGHAGTAGGCRRPVPDAADQGVVHRADHGRRGEERHRLVIADAVASRVGEAAQPADEAGGPSPERGPRPARSLSTLPLSRSHRSWKIFRAATSTRFIIATFRNAPEITAGPRHLARRPRAGRGTRAPPG